MRFGLIGCGVVGGATAEFLGQRPDSVAVAVFDPYKSELPKCCIRADSLHDAVSGRDVVFVCLPTPMNDDGEINAKAIFDTFKGLEECGGFRPGTLYVLRSTLVPGSCDRLLDLFPRCNLVFWPEFLVESRAVEDAVNADRFVVGCAVHNDFYRLANVLADCSGGRSGKKFFKMSLVEAEMVKYMSNVFLAAQVMVANELYDICQTSGANYSKCIAALEPDRRIGTHTRVPGPDGFRGFGGKCFPKDLNAIMWYARKHDVAVPILETIWDRNLKIRQNRDWTKIPGAVSSCTYDGASHQDE